MALFIVSKYFPLLTLQYKDDQSLARTDLVHFTLLTIGIINVAAVKTLRKESSEAQRLRTEGLLVATAATSFVEKDLRILPTGFVIWLGAILKK